MPIETLNPQEFATTLSQQASSYIPEDITEEQKQYISKKIYEFSFITADHLLKKFKEQLTDDESAVIIQYIGEWTFHKAIDLIRAGIRHEFWDTILQQVAFTALNASLQANSEKMDNAQTAALIETKVLDEYQKCIVQLVKIKAVKQEDLEKVLSFSNVDKMANESSPKNSFENDEKMMKCLAIALMLKKMPPEKAERILANFDETEKNTIISCLQIKDLESKVDARIINQYMSQLKKNLSSGIKPHTAEMIKLFKGLQENYGEEEIINLTLYERPRIQEFLSACILDDSSNVTKVELSPYIIKILYSYLKSTLAA